MNEQPPILAALIAFDTTSRESNLQLSHLQHHPFASGD